MAPVVLLCCSVLLLGSTVAQPPSYQVSEPQDYCCFGRDTYTNGQTVLTLPECCASLECRKGDLVSRYFGPPGSKNCCIFDGHIYPNGSRLSSYCVPLVCINGNWTYSHNIEDCCKMCKVYNGLHIATYDGYLYHWHGLCNHTITQTGLSNDPQIGVFSDLQPCFSGAFCLHITTFRNDDDTLLTLTHTITPSSLAAVHVLSKTSSSMFVVPSEGVHHVQSVSSSHPVLIWRDGDCVMLAGSSRIMIRHCHNLLTVWAYPTHSNQLDGLCGHFNFYLNDDMTNRDGTVHTPDPWPQAFPESWKTNDQMNKTCLAPCHHCKETTTDQCRATSEEMRYLQHRCAKVLNDIIGRDENLVPHVGTCAWDLCMATQALLPLAKQQRWIDEAKTIVRDFKMIDARTSGTWQPQSPPSSGTCSPGGRWKQQCYWCNCRTDASADCDPKLCPNNYEHEVGTDACTDGSWWQYDDCNWCECVQGGHVCNYKDCTSTSTLPSVLTPSTQDPCLSSLVTGSCQQFENKYYYNYDEGRCLLFRYSGCQGNANNFPTREECERTCSHLPVPPSVYTASATSTLPTILDNLRPTYCDLQPKKGPCEALIPRYYYNATTNSCESFIYGGCDANSNNFVFERDCEETCGVPSPVSTSLPFTLPSKCSLSLSMGYCTGRMTRYYYSPAVRSCVSFTYTGCGGNENNFPTKEYCEAICLGFSTGASTYSTYRTTTSTTISTTTTETSHTSPSTHCSLAPDAGHCVNNTVRYYYDSLTQSCKSFSYSGCGGNHNNFVSKEWCLASCHVSVPATGPTTDSTTLPAMCYQDFEIGTCFETWWRWYYDHERRSCQPFVYGGCYGNDNNFNSKEECEAACGEQRE